MVGEVADFRDYVMDRACPFFATGIGHYAERAAHVAALHNGNESRGRVRFREVLADGVL